jgi:hypothetical protein
MKVIVICTAHVAHSQQKSCVVLDKFVDVESIDEKHEHFLENSTKTTHECNTREHEKKQYEF